MVAMPTIRQFFHPYPLDTLALSLHAIGIQETMPPCIVNRPGGTGDFLLLFCYDPVLIGMEGASVQCPSNTLIVWEPGHRQSYGHPHQAWCHSWMHGDGQWVREHLMASGVPLNVPLPHDPEIAERYLLAIWREVSRHAAPDPVIVGNALHSWSREMHREALMPSSAPIPAPWLECRRFLHEHCTEAPSMPISTGS